MSPKKSEPVPRARLSLASRLLGHAVRGAAAAAPSAEPWRNAQPAAKTRRRR
jgi:hypothetical protein